ARASQSLKDFISKCWVFSRKPGRSPEWATVPENLYFSAYAMVPAGFPETDTAFPDFLGNGVAIRERLYLSVTPAGHAPVWNTFAVPQYQARTDVPLIKRCDPRMTTARPDNIVMY